MLAYRIVSAILKPMREGGYYPQEFPGDTGLGLRALTILSGITLWAGLHETGMHLSKPNALFRPPISVGASFLEGTLRVRFNCEGSVEQNLSGTRLGRNAAVRVC